jgi:hypothetical protein
VTSTLKRSDAVETTPALGERLAVWAMAFVFFAVFAPRLLDYLKPPTGDEVFYLITAQSILYDHDLDETNQFMEKAWLEYYPTCAEFLKPGWKGFAPTGIQCSPNGLLPEATHTTRPGTYTKHGLGLSFIIAPAYALGRRPAVVALLNALAALLALNIFLLGWEASERRWIAYMCWAPLSFAAPVFSYAYLIFPQPVSALCVVYAFRRARRAALRRMSPAAAVGGVPANTMLQILMVGLCLGALPWLHNLYVMLSVALVAYLYLGGYRGTDGLVSAVRTTATARAQVFLWLIIGGLGSLYVARQWYLYGVPWPPRQDHQGFNGPLLFPVGFFGLLFDQKYGLLMYNPVYLIPLAWLIRLACVQRRLSLQWRSEIVWLAAIIAPYYVVVASYSRWWGEWCPPARYLLVVAPVLTLPLARALVAARSRFLTWYYCAAVTWAGAITFVFVRNPILSYNWGDTQPCKVLLWLEDHYAIFKRIPLGSFFPYYVNFIEPLTPVYYVAHAAWLILAVWLGWRMFRGSRE